MGPRISNVLASLVGLALVACGGDDGGVCQRAAEVAEACGSGQPSSDCESTLDGCSDDDEQAILSFLDCVEESGECSAGQAGNPLAILACAPELEALSDDCAEWQLEECRRSFSCGNGVCECQTEGREGTSCCDPDECDETDPNSCEVVCRVCDPA